MSFFHEVVVAASWIFLFYTLNSGVFTNFGNFLKVCQVVLSLSLVPIMLYYTTLVKKIIYNVSMPRIPKKKLTPLNLSESTIGQRISIFRKKLNLTQKELAERIGIERIIVSDYERGRIRLYDEMVVRFAIALGVTTDKLLGLKPIDIPHYADIDSLNIRWLKKINEIKKLPESKQKEITRNINTLLENDRLKQKQKDMIQK